MSTAERNKKIKEKRIEDTALEMFLDKGVFQTTVDDIARKAGVAKGTFYLYFKDKNDIIEYLTYKVAYTLCSDAIAYTLESRPEVRGVERIIFAIDYIIDQLARNKKLTNFMGQNLSYGIFRDIIISGKGNAPSPLLEMMVNGLKESGVEHPHMDIYLFIIIELVGSACYNSIMFKQPLPIEQYKPHLFEAVRRILWRRE